MKTAFLAALLLAAPAARAGAAAESFAVDPKVELVSVVLMLAEPAEFRARRPDGLDAYAAAAEAAFAASAGHPAVARVRGGGAPGGGGGGGRGGGGARRPPPSRAPRSSPPARTRWPPS